MAGPASHEAQPRNRPDVTGNLSTDARWEEAPRRLSLRGPAWVGLGVVEVQEPDPKPRRFQQVSIVRLRTPATPVPDSADDDRIHRAHLGYLRGLQDRGLILVNGPSGELTTRASVA
jgi:hypothetical protein